MNKNYLKILILIALSINLNLSAQRVRGYISADSLILKGASLHDVKSYKSAIDEYKKVHPSDPKYALALYEIALSFSGLKQYDSTIFYITQSIEKNKIHLLEDAYIIRGAAYDNLKKYEQARANYEEALKLFPNNIRILHHVGISYYLQDSIQKAIDIFKEVNLKYSGYVKNQLVIAELAEKEGMLTQAFLAYCNALLYSLGSDRGQDILVDMDKLASKKYRDNPSGIVFSESGDNFSEIDALLRSKVSLQEKYKINTEIDFPIVRQLHLLFSQLENYEPTDGYFDKYYVPFYKKIIKENYFPELIGLMTMTVNNPRIKASFKKNEANILKFVEWTHEELAKSINMRELTVDGKKITLPCIFASGEKRCGEMVDGKTNGMWYYYHSNGNMEYYGENKNGEAEGLWLYFYQSGKKQAEINFSQNLKDGPFKKYYETGKLKETGTYKKDSLDGELTYYFELGNIQQKGNVVDNKLEGEWREYYLNGSLKGIYNYKNDRLEGAYTVYAEDGMTITRKLNYKEGQLDGDQKSNYNNGTIEIESYYVNGEKTGEFKEYYLSGKIKESGKNENNTTIDHKLFYANEKLNISYEYDKDEITGVELRNYDGELFSKSTYKNDIIKQVIYYDDNGKEVSKENIGKNDDYTSKWFYSGNKNTSGVFKKGKKQGKWEYYNINGSKDVVEIYNKGELNGLQKTYNEQGQLIKEYEMKEGSNHGFWRKYDPSGIITQEGWYEEGKKVGPWYEYYVDGTIKEEYYYSDDDLNGLDIEYDPDGKIDEIYHFEDGSLLSIDNYDNNGTLLFSTDMNQEKIQLKQSAKFQYASQRLERINGKMEGEVYVEPISGIFDYRGTQRSNENHGLFIFNFKNGKKYQSSNFFLGKKNGADTFFYINGNLYCTQEFLLGTNYGRYNRYYYNGAKYFDYSYYNDEKDGEENYYGVNGELFLTKYYRMGYLDYIIQNNASGEFKDTIRVQNETIELSPKYKNGQLALKEKIVADNLVDYKLYDDKGTLIYNIETDKNGLLAKKETFYTNGKLMSSETFINGEENGEEKFMREDGSLILSQEYKLGRYHGNVKIYDDAGQLKNHLIYRNGRAYEKIQ
jgi:uncharacterized protein